MPDLIQATRRTSNSAPSLEDLQDVIDNSNPLQLRTVNPNLVQDFTHNLTLRYFKMDMAKSTNFFAMLMGSAKQNAITTLTQLAGREGSTYTVGDSIFSLKPGYSLSIFLINRFNVCSQLLSFCEKENKDIVKIRIVIILVFI